MDTTHTQHPTKPGVLYHLLRAQVGYINALYHPHRYVAGSERIPPLGEATVFVGNHQNNMNDAICVLLSMHRHRPYTLVRSDIFNNRFIGNQLRKMRLLPIARMEREGEEAMKHYNEDTIQQVTRVLTQGESVMLFPETLSQDKRWLGYLSLAYLKMAFDAAEKMNFEREVYIMPFAHHYANYYHPGYDMVVNFGKPIALSAYYERYKEKPRSTMREINSLVELQLRNMMLDIRDLAHYTALDYLRESEFGKQFAYAHGYSPKHLPEQLAADQLLVSQLEQVRQADPKLMDYIYRRLDVIDTNIREQGMRDWVFTSKPTPLQVVVRGGELLLMLPLYAVSLLTTFPVFIIPRLLHCVKINGRVNPMFQSTFNVGTAVLISYPLFCYLPACILLFTGRWMRALGLMIVYPLMTRFVCWYERWFAKFKGMCNYIVADKELKGNIHMERGVLFSQLESMTKKIRNTKNNLT